MAAGLAFRALNARRDRLGTDTVFFTTVLTDNLHDSRITRRRCFRCTWTQRYGIAAGFAFGAGNSGWNLIRVHFVDFFTFFTGNLHGSNLS